MENAYPKLETFPIKPYNIIIKTMSLFLQTCFLTILRFIYFGVLEMDG